MSFIFNSSSILVEISDAFFISSIRFCSSTTNWSIKSCSSYFCFCYRDPFFCFGGDLPPLDFIFLEDFGKGFVRTGSDSSSVLSSFFSRPSIEGISFSSLGCSCLSTFSSLGSTLSSFSSLGSSFELFYSESSNSFNFLLASFNSSDSLSFDLDSFLSFSFVSVFLTSSFPVSDSDSLFYSSSLFFFYNS